MVALRLPILDLGKPPPVAPKLRLAWISRLERMSRPPLAHAPLHRLNLAVDIASAIIEGWAFDLEAAGWQPVHILRPPRDGDGGGLAWRWPSMPEIRHIGERRMVTCNRAGLMGCGQETPGNGLWMAYLASPDGSVTVLYGSKRAALVRACQPWRLDG